MNDQWIKFSERKPTESDLPVWTFSGGYISIWQSIVPNRDNDDYWMPANKPAPPKEKTQKELDESAMREWYASFPITPGLLEVWHASLAWERKEVGALLMTISDMPAAFNYEPHYKAVHALRKRIGL